MRTLALAVSMLVALPALGARPLPWQRSAPLTPAFAQRNAVFQGNGQPLKRIPWSKLRQLATEATHSSYAPYSSVHVGAAGITDKGTIVTGCNVENASYGLTNCAEGGMISQYVCDVRSKGEKLVAVAVVAGDGQPLAPCGRCRQVLYEFGGKDLRIDAGLGHRPTFLRTLLPKAFGPADVSTRSEKR